MSKFLDNITTGGTNEGLRIVIAGLEKMGKTTLTCDSPRSLLVPLEIGYSSVRTAKTPMIQTYDELMDLIGEICNQVTKGGFAYQTIVFDSVTALERHIHDAVIKRDPESKNINKLVSMESACGGYGKAYTYANDMFKKFLQTCDWLAVYGKINIVFTSHVFAAKLVDPSYGEYDSWDIRLHSPKNNKTLGKREIFTEWPDLIGFLHEPMYVSKGEDINKAISANKGRVLSVCRSPSYVAGNRLKLTSDIPIPLENGWNHLAQAIYNSSGIDIFNRDN